MARFVSHRREGRKFALPILCIAGLALAASASADDVILTNGKIYQDVVAESTESGVEIHLSFGEIVLPHSQVERIVEKESSYGEYLARLEQLRALHEQSPAAWLELAQWSAVNGLPDGARQAGLTAASLDPTLAGLPAILRPLGYVYDEASAQWLSRDELMSLRGFVRDGGEWVTVDERERRVASAREFVSRERDRLAEERARELEYLREREAAARAEPPAVGIPVYWGWGWGGGGWGGLVLPPAGAHPPRPVAPPPRGTTPAPRARQNNGSFAIDAVRTQQPGSFIPLSRSPSVISAQSGGGG